MVTRVDPFLGGLGIDATNKFEVASNATVTIGNGTSTGNVNVGGEVVSSTVDAATLKIGGTAVTATATELNYTDGVTSNIQTQLDAKLASSSYTAADVLTKIKTVDGPGSGLDADTLDGVEGSSYATLTGSQTLTNKTLTTPKIASGGYIADENGNEQIVFTTTASAVNYFTVTNTATGSNQINLFGAAGGDTNIGIGLSTKGTGNIQIGSSLGAGANPSRKLQIQTDSASKAAIGVQASGTTSTEKALIDFFAVNGTQLTSIGQGAATSELFRLDSVSGYIFATGSGSHAGGTERMRINSVGSVGIGNTSPSYLLDLYRSASTVARIRNSAATGGTPSATHGEFVIESTDANMGMQFLGSTTANQRILFGDTDSGGSGQVIYDHTSNYMALSTATAERMRITSAGLVGIGTTNPLVRLTVSNGSATGTALQVLTSGSGHNFDMVDGTGTARFRNVNGEMRFYGDLNTGGNGNIIFFPQGSTTERMRIDSSGNVGIGTSSPAVKMHITSNGSTYTHPADNNLPTLYLYNTNNASTNAHAILTLRTAGSAGGDPFVSFDIAGEAGWALGVDNSDSNKFKISSAWTDVGTNTELTLDNSGNLSVVGKLQEGGNSLIPPGSIIMYGAAAAPAGWYLCEGGAISRSTYSALFGVIGATYGAGDGSTTFNVPDFRDRAPYGASTFTLGSKTAGEVNASGQNSTGTGTSGSSGASTVANNTGTGTTGTGTTGTSTSGGTAPSIPAATYNTGSGTSGGSGASTVAANTGNAGATTVASNTGSGGAHGHTVNTSNTNSTTDKDVTNAITVVTNIANAGSHVHPIPALTVNAHAHSIPSLTVNSHTHTVPALSIPAMTVNSHTHSVPGLSIPGLSVPALSIPSLTVNGHTHSVPALTVTHPGVAVKFIIKT